MSALTQSRSRAAIVALAPMLLLAVFVAHPPIPGRLPNHIAVAEAAAAHTTRWGVLHLTTAVASGLLVLAFLALRAFLREAGDDRYSAFGVPFIVLGSTLYTMLPAMEFAPQAAAAAGAGTADIAAIQEALKPWFLAILLTGALTFAVGVLGFVKGIAHTKVLSPRLAPLVVGGLLVMAVSRFVPLAVVQFHVQGVAGLVALWPLAQRIWQHRAALPAQRVSPTAAV